MKDDILTQYKGANEKIQVPSQLKEDTIRLMKENKSMKQGHKPMKKYRYFAYAAALVGVLVLGIVSLQIRQKSEKGIVICDVLDENRIEEQVALSQGSLSFQGVAGEFSAPGLNLGIADGEKVLVSEEEYFGYLGENPLPSYVPKGMEKKEPEERMLTQKEDGSYADDLFLTEYEGDDESSLEILLSAKGIPKADEAGALESSLAGGIEIKTAFYGTKPGTTVFLAYFQTDGVGYRIKSRGISQEEFIQVLLSILNKE